MSFNRTERVYLEAEQNDSECWWSRYSAQLTEFTATARTALEIDSSYIVDRGIFGAGDPGGTAWPENRTRTGLIMGSVQSGKTASMFGVTALALDRGVDIVVILAGTRLSLWRQTYERLAEQLDTGRDSASRARRRIMCPAPGSVKSGASTSLNDTYRLPSAQVRRSLIRNRPLIVVAMKQTNHLYALGSALRKSVFEAIGELDRPVHMLVLDDEADDGSVLDAAVEVGQDPLSPNLKQIPRAIADLWDPRSTFAPRNFYTTYVGYTATPQANLLQEDHNPLAPRDFVISLRTPLDFGHALDSGHVGAPRSSTYPEPTGIVNFYTGGEVFYKRGASAGLCVEITEDAEDELGEALRAFLVAGAIRLYWSRTRLGPHSASTASFASREEAIAASPLPHSMLFHPSAEIGRHFQGAEDILLWSGISDRHKARELIERGEAYLPRELTVRMRSEQPLWESWIEKYRNSAREIATEFNLLNEREMPDWTTVATLLESEIIPGTRVAVVNSDPAADERPEYKPYFDEVDRRWVSARDLCTIFVSGNVMARGLTLEGLTTTLFQRSSRSPLADTQMQMQRWFGYRGKYIELCRLFAPRRQIDLFSAYHEIDEAVRISISKAMEDDAPAPIVLQGEQFLATGKIANLGRTPLCAGSKPFVTLINRGHEPDPNAQLVADLFTSRRSSDLTVGGTVRGRALDEMLSLTEAADLLDSLVFDDYRPGVDHPLGELWRQVQSRLEASYALPRDMKLYNAPAPVRGTPSPMRYDCPYRIPAYFRLWDACLTRPVRGLFVTGSPTNLWSMSDLRDKQLNQPKFSIGIRYGGGDRITSGPLAELGFDIFATNKRVGNTGELETEWGANNPEAGPLDFRGDEFFDYYHRRELIPTLNSATPWRPEGSHGQILFYVNQASHQIHPAVAVGVCIPAGGPEQFAATRSGKTGVS